MCAVCMFCSFTPFLTVFFVLHKNDLVLWNLISRYITSNSEQFCKSKDIVDLCKINFCIIKLFIQCNKGSCCVHITGGVNVYSHVRISLLNFECTVCVCLCVWFQVRVLVKTIWSVSNIRMMLCCMKHTRCCWYYSTKAW